VASVIRVLMLLALVTCMYRCSPETCRWEELTPQVGGAYAASRMDFTNVQVGGVYSASGRSLCGNPQAWLGCHCRGRRWMSIAGSSDSNENKLLNITFLIMVWFLAALLLLMCVSNTSHCQWSHVCKPFTIYT